MEQMRNHHTLHGTRPTDRKSDQMTTALHHWTWETENHFRFHLVKRNKQYFTVPHRFHPESGNSARMALEWHWNDLIPLEWHQNGTGIHHKGLIGSLKLT